jgi:tetratricopeptide (TPR) repeat protein
LTTGPLFGVVGAGIAEIDKENTVMINPVLSLLIALSTSQAPQQPPAQPAPATQNPQQPTQRDLFVTHDTDVQPAAKPKTVPRGWAVVVGIGNYKNLDPSKSLAFSESDAESVYRALISKEAGAFPAENVHKLIGSQATLANFTREIEEWLPSVAKDGDRVVVYFAGHGFSPAHKGYLALYDIDPKNYEETGYPMARLGAKLQNVKAQDKVLFVDACHSSKITTGVGEDSSASSEDLNGEVGRISRSFLTFAAARETESSFEDASLGGGAGLFTYYLVRGMQGDADQAPCDGIVTADELVEYVRENVRQYAAKRGRSQNPVEHGDFQPTLVLSLSQRCGLGAPGSTSTASLGDLVVEANMEKTEIYVDEKLIGTASPGSPLRVPGLTAGMHEITGVRKGYENDSKHIAILPGHEQSVKVRMLYPREIKKKSQSLMQEGEKLLYSKKSSLDITQIYDARSQNAESFKKAEPLFQQAVADDDKNARAFYDLGLTQLYLADTESSLKNLTMAVKIDPTYVEARQQLAGQLIESGDPDEAIRQLTEVTRMEPDNAKAYAFLSRAYYDKEVWDRSEEAASKAISLSDQTDLAYLWRGAAKRQIAAAMPRGPARLARYQDARGDFQHFITTTTISNNALSQVAFYAFGFGVGSRKHADRKASYDAMRSIAFMGLCDCESKLGNPLRATEFCQQALKGNGDDPVAYFLLGNAYRDTFNREPNRDLLLKARDSYSHMLALNSDMQESKHARDYIEQIDVLLPKVSK